MTRFNILVRNTITTVFPIDEPCSCDCIAQALELYTRVLNGQFLLIRYLPKQACMTLTQN